MKVNPSRAYDLPVRKSQFRPLAVDHGNEQIRGRNMQDAPARLDIHERQGAGRLGLKGERGGLDLKVGQGHEERRRYSLRHAVAQSFFSFFRGPVS